MTTQSKPETTKDLADYSMYEDPVNRNLFPFFAALRDEPAPIKSKRHKAWLVAHHATVHEALGHSGLSAQKLDPFIATRGGETREKLDRINEVLQHWVVFNDPPDHTRIRRALQQVLMPRDLLAFEGEVAKIVDEMLAELDGKAEFDFVEEFSLRLPSRLVCQLFGVPLKDADDMTRWGQGISRFVMGAVDDARYDATLNDIEQMRTYFAEMLEVYRVADDDTTLLRRLVAGMDTEDGLTYDEILATLVLILFAGIETTANALSNMVLTLATNPEIIDRVRENPEIAPAVVEEVLRFDSPAPMITRVVKEDITLGGVDIPAGDRLILMLASANRDEKVFEGAHTVRVDRETNPHVAFGRGIHFCMGAPLARMELRVVLHRLLDRLPHWNVDAEGIEWRDELLVRGMVNLPVTNEGTRTA